MTARLLTIREATSQFPGIDARTIRRAIEDGRLEALQLLGPNSLIRVPDQAIERWIEESAIAPNQAVSAGPAQAPGGTDTNFSFDY